MNTCCMQTRGKAGSGCLRCLKSMGTFSGAGWSRVPDILALFCFLVCSVHIGLNYGAAAELEVLLTGALELLHP